LVLLSELCFASLLGFIYRLGGKKAYLLDHYPLYSPACVVVFIVLPLPTHEPSILFSPSLFVQVDKAEVSSMDLQYTYDDGENFVFMNSEYVGDTPLW
jgi:hypothetical protein